MLTCLLAVKGELTEDVLESAAELTHLHKAQSKGKEDTGAD